MPFSSAKYREDFSVRLRWALSQNGLPVDSGTALQRMFNDRPDVAESDRVSPAAARKWTRGEAVPSRQKIEVLARMLNVDPTWLIFGSGSAARAQPPAPSHSPHIDALMLKIAGLPPEDLQLIDGIVNTCLARRRT